jgi:hypothetical protein
MKASLPQGVLSWQSQPRQGFQDRTVQELIAHDEVLNSIYLFLRTAGDRPYTFLGRLKYLLHDATREHPVYFQWQILDWDYRRVPLQRMNLTLTPEAADSDHVGSGLAGLVELFFRWINFVVFVFCMFVSRLEELITSFAQTF